MIKLGTPIREPLEEHRDLGRVVLAIGIERHDGRCPGLERVPEPRAQRRALAGIRLLADDGRPGLTGSIRGRVGRPVVDDHDRQVPPCRLDDRADPRRLLVRRDEREDGPLCRSTRGKYGRRAILMTDSGSPRTLHEFDASDRGDCHGEPAMTPIRPDSDASPLTPPVSPAAPEVDAVEFSKRTSGPSRLRVAAVAGAAAALVVGVVATSLAASPAPSASGSTSGSTGAVGAVPFAVLEPGLDEGIELDHGRLGGIGFREITISAISGSNVTLKTDDGWTRTIAVTDAVELTKGGQPIAAVRPRRRRPGPVQPDPQR